MSSSTNVCFLPKCVLFGVLRIVVRGLTPPQAMLTGDRDLGPRCHQPCAPIEPQAPETHCHPAIPDPQKTHPGEQSPQSPTTGPTGLMTPGPFLGIHPGSLCICQLQCSEKKLPTYLPSRQQGQCHASTAVLFCSGCHNKVPQSGLLQQQK